MSMMKRTLAAAAFLLAGISAASAQTYGSMNVATGFSPDPVYVELVAGGPLNVSQTTNGACNAGYVADAPDYAVNFAAGSNLPLKISAWSSVDTTLVIRAPNGEYFCDDDNGLLPLAPALILTNPITGRYDIWVGTYAANSNQKAVLSISELTTF